MPLKPKTINYRQIEFEPAAGDDLQALLAQRLTTPGAGVALALAWSLHFDDLLFARWNEVCLRKAGVSSPKLPVHEDFASPND